MARLQTRIVRALLRRLGYSLQRLQRTSIHDFDDGKGRGRGDGFDAFEPSLPRTVSHFDILFRSCARASMDGPDRRRFMDIPKSVLSATCLRSLVDSINDAAEKCTETKISLTVFDDHSDPEFVEEAREILAKASCTNRLVSLEVTGNGASLKETFTHARDTCKDVVYCIEDDYLHDLSAVQELIDSYARLSATSESDVVVLPYDYPEEYRRIVPTHVFLGSNRHWRRVWRSAGSFATSSKIMREYWERYLGLCSYGIDPDVTEENTIDLIYKEIPCFSPLPTVAVHMQLVDHISPFVPWRDWWKRYRELPPVLKRSNS